MKFRALVAELFFFFFFFTWGSVEIRFTVVLVHEALFLKSKWGDQADIIFYC